MTMVKNAKAFVSALGESLSAAMLTAESGFFAAARLRAHLRGAAPAATSLEPTPAAARDGVRAKPEGEPGHPIAEPAAGPRDRRPGRRAPGERGPRPARREAW